MIAEYDKIFSKLASFTKGSKIKDHSLNNGLAISTYENGAEVVESIIMPGAVIKSGAKVYKTIVGEKAVIGKNAKTGCSCKEAKVTLVGPEAVVEDEKVIEPGAIFGKEAAK